MTEIKMMMMMMMTTTTKQVGNSPNKPWNSKKSMRPIYSLPEFEFRCQTLGGMCGHVERRIETLSSTPTTSPTPSSSMDSNQTPSFVRDPKTLLLAMCLANRFRWSSQCRCRPTAEGIPCHTRTNHPEQLYTRGHADSEAMSAVSCFQRAISPANKVKTAAKPATFPEEDLISRQDWSCYGSSEIDLLVLRR
jgi:hypothetical protein